ncbi:thiamine-monophosphate kinase [Desulfatibacillum aliphaticivorans]|uniref:Thiamine-monophosphate kinase n=1 Tax=Desulfatibacillum aliphaticivorans TaxID=218208 RepID=B8FJW3_DESAL|nr:thiamine-phosphate kinase [Desulfatibacillum aliphaticivorans]ACL02391.1 thiamine-monophosphate kinase [Desulfatibacillum aliphaticivorans]
MDISQLGEFGLIHRIAEHLKTPAAGLVKGIGDDAAVFEGPPGWEIVITCDAQVEGVHFLPESMAPEQIGRKAAAINISDIAAMGAQPTFMLVSLGMPKTTPVSFVDGLYQGFKQECDRFGASIIGGNMAHCPERIFIDITLLGQVEKGRALYRSNAKPGDLAAVSGPLGDSAAGLSLLLAPEVRVDEKVRASVLKAHFTPNPRVDLGRALSASGLITAALDVSDGAAQDLGHICEESKLGAVLWAEKVPLSQACKEVGKAAGKNPWEFAMFGGEDYELLFTFSEENQPAVQKVLTKAGFSMTIIGRMEEGDPKVRILAADGSAWNPKSTGWTHF